MAEKIELVDELFDDMNTYVTNVIVKTIEQLEIIDKALEKANQYISESSLSSGYNFTHTS